MWAINISMSTYVWEHLKHSDTISKDTDIHSRSVQKEKNVIKKRFMRCWMVGEKEE